MAFEGAASTSAPGMSWTVSQGRLAEFGRWAAHYALVVIFLWFGLLKFTEFEASGIAPLIMNSPLVAWWHGLFGIDGAARVLGVYEIATALLLSLRPFKPQLAAVGGAMAVLTFVVTLSFMLTTPGVAQPGAGSPLALSPCLASSC